MATQEVKTIHGKDYLYLTYYDDSTKRKKTVYCGPKSKHSSKKKAVEKEIEIIDSKITEYQTRKKKLQKQLKNHA